MMINIRTLNKLQENDGLTLKNGKVITYKSGYRVADFGYELKTAKEAIQTVRELKGNCGVWYSNGIYYVDHSYRVSTKNRALSIGREHNQISILKWNDMSLIYC